jgi:hypothetical protein
VTAGKTCKTEVPEGSYGRAKGFGSSPPLEPPMAREGETDRGTRRASLDEYGGHGASA